MFVKLVVECVPIELRVVEKRCFSGIPATPFELPYCYKIIKVFFFYKNFFFAFFHITRHCRFYKKTFKELIRNFSKILSILLETFLNWLGTLLSARLIRNYDSNNWKKTFFFLKFCWIHSKLFATITFSGSVFTKAFNSEEVFASKC